jgi:hypothetical protein
MGDELTSSGTEAVEAEASPPRVLGRAIYCRRCDYDLRAAASGPCPECGAPFDRLRPHTFALRTRAQDRFRLSGVVFLSMTIFTVLAMGTWWFGVGFAMLLFPFILGLVLLLLAAVSVQTGARMLTRRGRRRELREFQWPGRRRW